jgi:hypothetical protein
MYSKSLLSTGPDFTLKGKHYALTDWPGLQTDDMKEQRV